MLRLISIIGLVKVVSVAAVYAAMLYANTNLSNSEQYQFNLILSNVALAEIFLSGNLIFCVWYKKYNNTIPIFYFFLILFITLLTATFFYGFSYIVFYIIITNFSLKILHAILYTKNLKITSIFADPFLYAVVITGTCYSISLSTQASDIIMIISLLLILLLTSIILNKTKKELFPTDFAKVYGQYFRTMSQVLFSKLFLWGGIFFIENLDQIALFFLITRIASGISFIPNSINFLRIDSRDQLSMLEYKSEGRRIFFVVSLISIIAFFVSKITFLQTFLPSDIDLELLLLVCVFALFGSLVQPLNLKTTMNESNLSFVQLILGIIGFIYIYIDYLAGNQITTFKYLSVFTLLNIVNFIIKLQYYWRRQ